MDLTYSHIKLDHIHVNESVDASSHDNPREEGWYLNPFDCREEMLWTGSAWTRRRPANKSNPAPLGFQVRDEVRDVRIRAEIHRESMKPKAIVRRPSTLEIVLSCVSVGVMLLTIWKSAIVRVIDAGAGIDLAYTFRDARSDPDFQLVGFLLGYPGNGVVFSTACSAALIIAVIYGRLSVAGLPRQIFVLSIVFLVLGCWLLAFVLTIQGEADFGEGGLLLGIWLALISHLVCAGCAFSLSRSPVTRES